MAAVVYERIDEDIHAAEDEISLESDASEANDSAAGPAATQLFPWPGGHGVIHLSLGFLLAAAGLLELIVLPLVNNKTEDRWPVRFNKMNCYGMGLWAGLMFVLSGTLALRSSIHQSISAMYAFFTVILLEIPFFCSVILMLVVEFTGAHKGVGLEEVQFYLHLSIVILNGICLVEVMLCFTQFYETVYFGQMQLCRRCIHCCFPCFCPRVVTSEELLEGEGRPPSLPI